MSAARLPAPRIYVDGELLAGVETELAQLGGYDLTIHTGIPAYGLDVQSSVLGHPASATAIAHLVVTPGSAEVGVASVAAGGLHGDVARASRLLDHYLCLQTALQQLTGSDVRVDLTDRALPSGARS